MPIFAINIAAKKTVAGGVGVAVDTCEVESVGQRAEGVAGASGEGLRHRAVLSCGFRGLHGGNTATDSQR